jgi:hypothetical protein
MAAVNNLFDAAALDIFFEDAGCMGLSNRTCLQLAHEGITDPEDFKEFDKDGLSAIFLNLCKPPKVPAPGPAAAAAGRLREIQAYEVSAKSKMRLKGAMLIVKFCDDIGHPLDPDNMAWSVIKHFLEQWKALMERKKAENETPPKISKHQAVHKWVDAFSLHLSQKIGVHNAPVGYVVWVVAAVDATPPASQAGDPHSVETGSIEGDLTVRMTHNHPLYKVDNGSVFNMIKIAVRGHDVAATITLFHRACDGRGAPLALQSQHAGKAIYDQLVKEEENVLKNRQWSGTTSITLRQHMGLQQKGFITLSECAEQISAEVPNEQAQVTYLLDLITMNDPNLLATTAAVCQDDASKRVNFENSFTFLAPTCPVAAKLAKKGRVLFDANVSGTNGKPQGGLGGDRKMPGKGASGVALPYHKFDEFKNFPKDQKDELIEWNKANGKSKGDKGGGKGGKGGKQGSPGGSPRNDPTKKLKSMISEMEACQTKMYEAMADVQTTSIAAIQATMASPTPPQRATTVGAVIGTAAIAPEVMIERANVAMMKLTGILKSKEKKT